MRDVKVILSQVLTLPLGELLDFGPSPINTGVLQRVDMAGI
jgi:hypothetical protein